MTNQENDYRWYIANFNQLYQRYGAGYVIILDKMVIKKLPTFAEAYHKALELGYKEGDFIIQQLCEKLEDTYISIYSFRSPELWKA